MLKGKSLRSCGRAADAAQPVRDPQRAAPMVPPIMPAATRRLMRVVSDLLLLMALYVAW